MGRFKRLWVGPVYGGRLKSAEAPPSLRVLALLIALAALAACWTGGRPGHPLRPPEQSWPARAVWRQDGGQNLSLEVEGYGRPSALSRMALGYKVDLGRAGQRELMALPGLGPGRTAKIIRSRNQDRAYWEARDLGLNEPVWRDLEPYAKLPD